MHRALLITLPEFGEAGRRALAMIRCALECFGFEDFVQLPTGSQLTRASVHEALDELATRAGPNDACVVYYFGHGQRVVFEDLAGPFAGRTFSYLRCHRDGEFDALLDIPLRTRLHRLSRACNNLVVILDACHSGKLVRSIPRRHPTPAWLPDDLARHDPRDAPPIVCLAGAPPLSEASRVAEHDIGHLSAELCRALHEIATRRATVSWHALAHRVRGRVITNSGSEHQWIVASGPCERVLFSRESIADTAAVGFVVTREHAWLRIGTLQGSTIGDRWTLHDLDERVLAYARVLAVELNRSALELDAPLAADEPREGHARLVRAAMPTGVELDAHLAARCAAQLADSPWLERVTTHGEARLDEHEGELLARDCSGRWPATRGSLERCADAIASIEGHARSRRLLAIPTMPSPLQITGMPTRLRAEEALVLQLACAPNTPDTLFVQLVLIDAQGQPWRLAPEQPEGIEISREQPQTVHVARALTWPEGYGGASLPCTLVALAASRPLQIAHLAHDHPCGGEDGLSLGLAAREPRKRGTPTFAARAPVVTQIGGVQHIPFELVR